MDFATSYGTRVLSPFDRGLVRRGLDAHRGHPACGSSSRPGASERRLRPERRARLAAVALVLACADYAVRASAHAVALGGGGGDPAAGDCAARAGAGPGVLLPRYPRARCAARRAAHLDLAVPLAPHHARAGRVPGADPRPVRPHAGRRRDRVPERHGPARRARGHGVRRASLPGLLALPGGGSDQAPATAIPRCTGTTCGSPSARAAPPTAAATRARSPSGFACRRRATSSARASDRDSPMGRLGSHMSIAGGLPLAVDRAALHGCEALQIFSKSSNQWRARTLPADEIATLPRQGGARGHRAGGGARQLPDQPGRVRTRRCANGRSRRSARNWTAPRRSGSRASSSTRAATRPAPRNDGLTAGGGRGARPAEGAAATGRRWSSSSTRPARARRSAGASNSWRAMIEHLDGASRVAVCLDTCHLWAAGYDLGSEEGYRATFDAFDRSRRPRPPPRLSRQRLEEAARQPARSARSHRQGHDRPRGVPRAW